MAPKSVHIGSRDTLPEWAAFGGPSEAGKGSSGSESERSEGWIWEGSSAIRWAAILTGTAAAVVFIGAVAIAALIDVDDFVDRATPQASALLNRQVEVGGAGVTFLPRPGIRLRDVRIHNLAGFDGPDLAVADRIDLAVALAPLFNGTLAVDQARVAGLRVYLGIDEQGISNFGDLVPERRSVASTPEPGRRITVSRVDLADASFTYFDVPGDRSMVALGTRAELTVAPGGSDGGWQVVADARPDSLHFRVGGDDERIVRLGGPELDVTVAGDGSFAWLGLQDGHLAHQAISLDIEGRVDDLDQGHPHLALRLTNPAMNAAALTSLLSERTKAEYQPYAEGTVAVALRAAGPLDGDGLVVRGTVGMKNAGLRLRGEHLVSGVTGTMTIEPDSLRAESIRGMFASGDFELRGGLDRVTRRGALELTATPDLEILQRVGLGPAGPDLSGDANIDLSVEGTIHSLDAVDVWGTVTLEGVRAEHPRIGVPIYVPQAEVTVDGADLSWSQAEILAGDASFVTDGSLHADLPRWWRGEVTPDIDASVEGSRLDLSALIGGDHDAPSASYAHLAFAHLGDEQVDGKPARVIADERGFVRPRDLPIRGRIALSMDRMTYRDVALDTLSARLVLADSAMTVTDASFRLWDGTASGSLWLAVGDALDEPFELELHGEGLPATTFLTSTTPLQDAISGTLALDLSVTGATDLGLLPVPGTLDGTARVSVTDGQISDTGLNLALADFLSAESWHELAFTSWDTDVRFGDRGLEIRQTRIHSEAGEISSAGTLDLDGSLDLSMGLSIPADRLGEVSLRRTGIAQTVLGSLRRAGEPLVLGLRVAGTLAGPTMEPDALAVGEAVVGTDRR